MADVKPDNSSVRVKGVSVVKPIVVGNVARYFGKKRQEDGHTHQWTVYVRPYPNEDYSPFIKKVQFKLHDSYSDHTRILTKPPYEVTETGWGEFEIGIRIYFNDSIERPVSMYHILKLFHPGADPTVPPVSKKNVVAEFYDEIVFLEPTQHLLDCLNDVKPYVTGVWKHDTDFEEKKSRSLQAISAGRAIVKSEILDLKSRLTLAHATIETFRAKLQEALAAEETENQNPENESTNATEKPSDEDVKVENSS